MHFNRFPKDNDKLLVKWLRNMNMKNFVPSERSVLCSDHFEKHYIRKTNVDKNLSSITRNAVPTIFLRNEGKHYYLAGSISNKIGLQFQVVDLIAARICYSFWNIMSVSFYF